MSADPAADESTVQPPSSVARPRPEKTYRTAWPWVLCVIGLDYLSTLAYQPSVTFGAAGRLAPLVTILVAAVTVFLALPIYLYIAGRSPHGGGSTALLERCIPGWFGKLLLLVFLSFGFTGGSTTTATVTGGVATFNNLVLNTAGDAVTVATVSPGVEAGTIELTPSSTSLTLTGVGFDTTAHAPLAEFEDTTPELWLAPTAPQAKK